MTLVKQIISAITLLILSCTAYSQEIVKIVYVDDQGITENIKGANSLIALKLYPDGIFERLDYKLGAPLVMLRTYNDSNLTNLSGKYLKYYESGHLKVSGQYNNNKKVGDWFYYNDTDKIILTETYEDNLLIRTENSDTVKKDSTKYGDEREAEFGNGKSAWRKYLFDAYSKISNELSLLKGDLHVMFMVSGEGKFTDIYLKKSAQFSLDEAALKIVRLSPLWKPAFQNGHTIKAYRVQPFTFMGEVQ